MIEIKDRVIFLDKIHLLSGLDQGQLAGIAQKLTEREELAGKVFFKRGDSADGFYMVYKGRVKVVIPTDKGERQIATLGPGDYFGEEALFEHRKRSASIIAVEDTTFLFLSREGFELLLNQYEKLKPNFQVAIKSRKLARATRFKWLGKNEVIYFIARRHVIRLYQALAFPALALLVPLGLLLLGSYLKAITSTAVGVVALIADLGWIVWNWIDWSNDYYIVTNQRVVWLEKVIFLYDSREEAPLGSILSVGVETDMLGRIFNFGNVIVRTFVGKLEFDHVDHPVQAADMIREYWERTKAITTRSQMDVMKDTIKQKLGLPVAKRPQVELSPVVPVDEEKIAKTPLWLLAMQNLFQLRLEDGGKVIYRKHWLVLLQQGWKPFLSLLGVIAMFTWRLSYLYRSQTISFFHTNAAGWYVPDSIAIIILMLLLPVGFWLWYEYEDWKNDIFMVTQDEIFDIDRKPFAQEERRSAQIENILSTSYSRNGIIANLFNYGTVKITVGGTQLAFEDVMDPASVQADINRRRSARITKKNEDAGSADRERFATWLAAYHKYLDEFNAPITAPEPSSTNQFSKFNPEVGDVPISDDEDGDGYDGSNGQGMEPGDF